MTTRVVALYMALHLSPGELSPGIAQQRAVIEAGVRKEMARHNQFVTTPDGSVGCLRTLVACEYAPLTVPIHVQDDGGAIVYVPVRAEGTFVSKGDVYPMLVESDDGLVVGTIGPLRCFVSDIHRRRDQAVSKGQSVPVRVLAVDTVHWLDDRPVVCASMIIDV